MARAYHPAECDLQCQRSQGEPLQLAAAAAVTLVQPPEQCEQAHAAEQIAQGHRRELRGRKQPEPGEKSGQYHGRDCGQTCGRALQLVPAQKHDQQ